MTVRHKGVMAVAMALGTVRQMDVNRPQDGLGPCPLCGQLTRHRKTRDRRGAIGLTRDGRGWRCFQCGAGGDACAFAAATVTGSTSPGSRGWCEVRQRLLARGFFQQEGAQLMVGAHGGAGGKVGPPPAGQVAAVWAACVPVAESTEASLWLYNRSLCFARVTDFDLARALRPTSNVPSWAWMNGQPWTRSGHRLVVLLHNHKGRPASLHARSVDLQCPRADKAASPCHFEVRGLVMACALARRWLADECIAGVGSAASYVARVGLVVAEGLPDWLSWASQFSDADQDAPAVLGIVSGSWSQEIARKIPDACSVTIATHHDKQGNKYAAQIIDSLRDRQRNGTVRIQRTRPIRKPTQ